MDICKSTELLKNVLGAIPWWRHQMETFSALLALCAGISPVSGEFPSQRPVTRSFDGFFDLRLNKRLSEQSWGWWFETPSRPLWRHCNANICVWYCRWHGGTWCWFDSYPLSNRTPGCQNWRKLEAKDIRLDICKRSEIRQAFRRQCCRSASPISKPHDEI